jgi:hypothetical protein
MRQLQCFDGVAQVDIRFYSGIQAKLAEPFKRLDGGKEPLISQRLKNDALRLTLLYLFDHARPIDNRRSLGWATNLDGWRPVRGI